jgi:hypothetical protein
MTASDDKLKELSTSQPIKNACYRNKRDWSPEASLEVAEIAEFDLSRATVGEKLVVAKKGSRVLLKEYCRFRPSNGQ